MDSSALADYIARHALTALMIVTLLMVLLTAACWRVIEKTGPGILAMGTRTWNTMRERRLTHRLRSAPLVGTALGRALTMGRYLGIQALISFGIALLALGMFFELADEIGVGEDLAKFDLALSNALAVHLSDTMLQAFAVLTHLGDTRVLTVLATGVAIGLLWRRRHVLTWGWIIATAGGGMLTRLLKAYFERTRPLHEHGFASAEGWSFPSGHASGSMLVYGMIGYLIVRHTKPVWHIPVVVITLVVIVCVGSSRVLLQVHYFSDVLAGWMSAIAWLALCIAGLEAYGRRVSAIAGSFPPPVAGGG